MNDPTAQAELRRCTSCNLVKPIDQFRRRYTGTDVRHARCSTCENFASRQLRLRRRDKRLHKFNQHISNEVRELSAMAAATSEIIRRFGGVSGFVDAWRGALSRAAQGGKHYLVSRGLITVFKLINSCTEMHQLQPQPHELTDDDLERQMQESLTRVVQQNPELAVFAARKLGWEITPLGSDGEDDT